MSLQVWLPLNGNLENKGLSNFSFSTLGTVTYPNGKIGKCMKAGDGTQIVNGVSGNSNLLSELGDEYSCTVWVCPDGTHIHYNGTILSSGNWNSSCWAFGVNQNNTAVDVFCKGYNTYINCSVPVGQWTHLACTQKDKIVRLYKNGEYVGSYTASQSALASDANNFCIGRETYASGYFSFNGKINDVRIYNHCLSDKEVKEISKGLALHYKLDGNCGGNDNLFRWSTLKKYNQELKLNDYQSTGSFTQFSNSLDFDPSTTVGEKYTISFDAKSPNGITRLQLYNSNSNPQYFYFSTTLTSNLGTEWQHFSYTVTNTQYSGSSTPSTNTSIWKRIEIYASQQMGVLVRNIKVEKGDKETPWTPNPTDLGIDSNKVVDCSGNGYDGTVNGSLTTSSDTARYLGSTVFDGNTASITLGNLSTICPEGNFTFNCWIYKDGTWSTKTWETIFGGPSGFELETKYSSTNSPVLFNYNWGKTSMPYNLNEWTMITMTRNSSETKYYINGSLAGTGTAGTIPSGNYFIGSWSTSSGQNYKGKVSDVRIYNTVLSESDIKELYETSASIDKNGNLYCRELVEV